MKRLYILAGIICLLLSGCAGVSINVATTSPTPSSSSGTPHWGKQAKTSGCAVQGALPDSDCTPGDILPDATKDQICQSGYAKTVRNVPDSEKNQVFTEYSITSHSGSTYEVDHLVSLELGGSNDISNLWPEAASPTPGFHQKDKTENYLHAQVCSGAISLQQAQIEIATNWLSVYNQMPGADKTPTPGSDGSP